MGVKGPPDIIAALNLPSVDDIVSELGELSEVIGEYGEASGRGLIETRPTTRNWSSRFAGNPRRFAKNRKGRVDTGQMRDDYQNRATMTKQGVWTIDIGWVDGDKGYYADQEYGFEHEHAGPVEPMLALTDSRIKTKEFASGVLKGWVSSYGNRRRS